MFICTPEEIAAHRVAYMHSLAVALLAGGNQHWRSATDEERNEVRSYLTRARIKFPSERAIGMRERVEKEAAVAKQAKAAKLSAKLKRAETASTPPVPEAK